MSYTVGEQVNLTTIVRDPSGNPIDATVTLTVTRPDLTTTTPSIVHTGTGAYSSSITTNQVGTWLYLWAASGTAVGVDDGQFEVTSTARRIVSLADVKKHLNMKLTDTTNDVELQDIIDAAQDMIEREIGPVIPKTYTEVYDGGSHEIVLYHGPIVSVTSVNEYWNGTLVKTLTTNEYVVDTSAGSIARTLAGGQPACFIGLADDIRVVYVGGRAQPVPANIRLAAKELTGHLWRNTQLGRTRRAGRTATDEDSAPIGLGFSMPARVKEMLGARRPVIL